MSTAEHRDAPAMTALITGPTGVAGSAVVEALAARPGCHVLTVSRSTRGTERASPRVTHLAADLADRDGLRAALAHHEVTHVFYAAQYRAPPGSAAPPRPLDLPVVRRVLDLTRAVAPPLVRLAPSLGPPFYTAFARESGLLDPDKRNLAMLRSLLDVVEAPPHRVRHVALITGGRFYGQHLGPRLHPRWKVPFEELDPRHPGPSWYFDIEDHLRARAEGKAWTWSIVRPSFIIGSAPHAPQDFGTSLAVYASLRKELGLPLTFPGDERSYGCLWSATCAALLARMMSWTADSSAGHDQIFNCVNGDAFRWRELWPRIAAFFGMEADRSPRGFSVARWMRDRGSAWDDMVRRHGLRPHKLDAVLGGHFIDQSMVVDWDVLYSMRKAEDAGFCERRSTEAMFFDLFRELRDQRVIP